MWNIWGISKNIYNLENEQKQRTRTQWGGRLIGSVFFVSAHYFFTLCIFMDIPYIFLMYFLNIFHICSLVCFLIYGVNRRQVLCFLEDFALTWSFWDMMDMSMFRLLFQFRTLRVQSCLFEVISQWFRMVLLRGVRKTLFLHPKLKNEIKKHKII